MHVSDFLQELPPDRTGNLMTLLHGQPTMNTPVPSIIRATKKAAIVSAYAGQQLEHHQGQIVAYPYQGAGFRVKKVDFEHVLPP
ncbi:hypothetical protein M1N92_00795 [Dehalococcoidia bacterium]|nr:hypothetical protein [Dehalococcoidia bacterium]